MVYFSSDFHLGHKNIHKYRDFGSENGEFILNQLSELKKRDILFVLGDFLFPGPDYEKYLEAIGKMPFRMKLILGNHDSLDLYDASKRPKNIELQLPLFSYKNMWVSHAPIHPNEIRNRTGCIHGHLHKEILDDPRYLNVNIDVQGRFVTLDEIKEYFKKEKDEI